VDLENGLDRDSPSAQMLRRPPVANSLNPSSWNRLAIGVTARLSESFTVMKIAP